MARRKTRLLLVDDNAAFRQRLVEFLREYADLEVIGEAGNGRDALDKAKELRPDLVLMDVRMPETNGLATITAIKGLPAPPKVIVLTVFDFTEYRQSAEIAGADGYIVKAAIPDELVPAIRIQVDRGKDGVFKRKGKGKTEVDRP